MLDSRAKISFHVKFNKQQTETKTPGSHSADQRPNYDLYVGVTRAEVVHMPPMNSEKKKKRKEKKALADWNFKALEVKLILTI